MLNSNFLISKLFVLFNLVVQQKLTWMHTRRKRYLTGLESQACQYAADEAACLFVLRTAVFGHLKMAAWFAHESTTVSSKRKDSRLLRWIPLWFTVWVWFGLVWFVCLRLHCSRKHLISIVASLCVCVCTPVCAVYSLALLPPALIRKCVIHVN